MWKIPPGLQQWLANYKKSKTDQLIKDLENKIIKAGLPRWGRPAPDPKKPFEDGYNFAEALKKRGFKEIGYGYYSSVLHKEGSNKVIKVSKNMDTWPEYVEWCQSKGWDGKIGPKVFSLKTIKGKRKDFYVAVIEKLDKTLVGVKNKHPLALVPMLADWALESDNDTAKDLTDLLVPGYGEFARQLTRDFEIKGKKAYRLDLHKGNWMLRVDGSIVLNDPLAGDPKREVKRLRTTVGAKAPALAA